MKMKLKLYFSQIHWVYILSSSLTFFFGFEENRKWVISLPTNFILKILL